MSQRTGSALDLIRQLLVTAGFLVLALGAAKVTGVVRLVHAEKLQGLAPVDVDHALGGWYATWATLLAPAAIWQWVWVAVLVGMLAYTWWQWRPENGDEPRCQASGWWLALAMASLGAVVWLIEANLTWSSVAAVGAAAVFGFLGVWRQIETNLPTTWPTRLMTDVGPELLLGSALVFLLQAVAAGLGASNRPLIGMNGQWLGLLGLALLVVLSGAFIRVLGPRVVLALGMVWGLGCLTWARLVIGPHAQLLGWGSAAATIMVAFLTLGSLIHVRP